MKTADEIRKEIIDNTVDDLPIRELRGEMTKQEWAGWFEEVYDKAYKEGLNASQFKTVKPSIKHCKIDHSGIAAFHCDCVDKCAVKPETVEPEKRAELLKEIMDTDQEHGMYEPEKKCNGQINLGDGRCNKCGHVSQSSSGYCTRYFYAVYNSNE